MIYFLKKAYEDANSEGKSTQPVEELLGTLGGLAASAIIDSAISTVVDTAASAAVDSLGQVIVDSVTLVVS